jgi:uncharacterized protein YeaO (DUF488 family)
MEPPPVGCASAAKEVEMPFQIRRVYEPATPSDGSRILIDRLWPRGISKARADVAMWIKDIAPSNALRVWFGHKPERFAEFSRRYRKELAANILLTELRKLGRGGNVTLVYAARDSHINHAQVLLSVLRPTRSRAAAKAKASRKIA